MLLVFALKINGYLYLFSADIPKTPYATLKTAH